MGSEDLPVDKKLTMNKKQFFKDKIKNVTFNVWELEFKVSKSRQVREGVRQDRDRAIEDIARLEAQIAQEKDKDKLKELEAAKATFADNVKRYEAQMLMIDKQINGFAGTETEEPVIGILEQLKSLAELREMYKQHIASF